MSIFVNITKCYKIIIFTKSRVATLFHLDSHNMHRVQPVQKCINYHLYAKIFSDQWLQMVSIVDLEEDDRSSQLKATEAETTNFAK